MNASRAECFYDAVRKYVCPDEILGAWFKFRLLSHYLSYSVQYMNDPCTSIETRLSTARFVAELIYWGFDTVASASKLAFVKIEFYCNEIQNVLLIFP